MSQEKKSKPSECSDNPLSLVTGEPGDENMSKSLSTPGGQLPVDPTFFPPWPPVFLFLVDGRDALRFPDFGVIGPVPALLSKPIPSDEKQNSDRLGVVPQDASDEDVLACVTDAGLREYSERGRFFLLRFADAVTADVSMFAVEGALLV